jgi:hypothetical protein
VPIEIVGGWMPKPRKLRLASASMMRANSSVAIAIIDGRMLGNRWRAMMRSEPAPSERVARTKSVDR